MGVRIVFCIALAQVVALLVMFQAAGAVVVEYEPCGIGWMNKEC